MLAHPSMSFSDQAAIARYKASPLHDYSLPAFLTVSNKSNGL